MTSNGFVAALPFIHPGLAMAALMTGLIPIVLHLINRRRYQRVAWAAMPFLVAANRRSAARVRMEQWLLLLLRVSLIVLLGLALARPYVTASAAFSLGVSRGHRILVIDDSLSMNARFTGSRLSNDGRITSHRGDAAPRVNGQQTRFERARQSALDLLDSFPETDAVSVVTVAAPARAVVAAAVYERRIVRERIAGLAATQRRADLPGALAEVAKILRDAEVAADNRSVYVISDLPRHIWLGAKGNGTAAQAEARGSGSTPTPAVLAARKVADILKNAEENLHFVRTGAAVVSNLAVNRLEVVSPMVTINFPIQLVTEITNFGDSTARGLALQLRRDEEIIRQAPLPPIEPGRSVVIRVSVEFASAGTHLVEARLIASTEDYLQADDSRWLSIEVPESIAALLVDGRPEAFLLGGQAGYLATALAPGADSRSDRHRLTAPTLVTPKVVSEPELLGEALLDYDVIVLCNVHRMAAGQWDRLGRFVARGGGLLVFGGDLVNTDNYNRYGHVGGTGLLGAKLHRSAALPATTGRPPGFRSADLTHPIVREFVTHADSGLFLARVDRYLPVEADLDRADVILRYTNDEPAMLAVAYGRGRVIMFTTTANMEWTNLPGKGDFVSLMLNTVAHLSPGRGVHRNVEVGHHIREPLTAAESSLPIRITTGDGSRAEGHVVPLEDGLAFEFGPVERSGSVVATIGSVIRGFAVNVDTNESDLAAVTEQALRARLDRPFRFVDGAADVAAAPVAARSSEMSSLVLYCVLALLFIESLLAMQFGSRRAMAGGLLRGTRQEQ